MMLQFSTWKYKMHTFCTFMLKIAKKNFLKSSTKQNRKCCQHIPRTGLRWMLCSPPISIHYSPMVFGLLYALIKGLVRTGTVDVSSPVVLIEQHVKQCCLLYSPCNGIENRTSFPLVKDRCRRDTNDVGAVTLKGSASERNADLIPPAAAPPAAAPPTAAPPAAAASTAVSPTLPLRRATMQRWRRLTSDADWLKDGLPHCSSARVNSDRWRNCLCCRGRWRKSRADVCFDDVAAVFTAASLFHSMFLGVFYTKNMRVLSSSTSSTSFKHCI